MAVFLSYARQDTGPVEPLRRDLEDLIGSVWIDSRLTGGQDWWNEILGQIRDCQLFVMAVSSHSLHSEACRAEAAYANALGRPFLAVRTDNVDLIGAPDAVRRTQVVDYRPGNSTSVKGLAKALMACEKPGPLPVVMPAPPPPPMSYRDRFAGLFTDHLDTDKQVEYLVRLRIDLENAQTSAEAFDLVGVLYAHPDLSWKVRKDIDRLLADREGIIVTPTPQPLPTPRMLIGPVRRSPRHRRLTRSGATAAGVVAGVAAVAIVLVLLSMVVFRSMTNDRVSGEITTPVGSDELSVEMVRDSCTADDCLSGPISISVSPPDGDGSHTVVLTRPDGTTDDFSERGAGQDGRISWTWSAHAADPIGEYIVEVSAPGVDPVELTFTVNPIDGPYGVVQRLAAALMSSNWDEAADLDHRLAVQRDEGGIDSVASAYVPYQSRRLVPGDRIGRQSETETVLTGAFVGFDPSIEMTVIDCEIWTIDGDGMRSDTLKKADGSQIGTKDGRGRLTMAEAESLVAEFCGPDSQPTSQLTEILDAPVPTAGSINDGILLMGSSGDDVTELRRLLSDAHYDPGDTEGDFDDATRRALLTFEEQWADAPPDGQIEVNGDEWAVLEGVAKRGQCVVQTSNVQFRPAVARGTPVVQTVALTGDCTQSAVVTLGNAVVDPIGTFTIDDSSDCDGAMLSNGESCDIRVRFAPDEAGDFSGDLTVPHDAIGEESVISLHGTAIATSPTSTTKPCWTLGTCGAVPTDAEVGATIGP